MNLSLERLYRQFSGEPLTLQTVIDKIRDGSFRLYIPTPQSEDQPGTIAQIKASLPHIANIVRAPYITLKTEHPKVRAERASALSPEGIRETVRDGRIWRRKKDRVLPEYVYATEREDDYNSYENRMVKALIDRLIRFLSQPLKVAKEGVPSLYEAYFQISNLNKLDWMKIMETDVFRQDPAKSFEQYSELYRLKGRVNQFRFSFFYKTMCEFQSFTGPLEMTNLLTHNEDYHRCAKLWAFLDAQSGGGATLEGKELVNAYALFLFIGLVKAYTDMGMTLKDQPIRYARDLWRIPTTTLENETFTVDVRMEDKEILIDVRAKQTKRMERTRIRLVLDYDITPERDVSFYVSLFPTPYSDNAACVVPNNLNSIKDLAAIAQCTVLTFRSKKDVYSRYCLVCGNTDIEEKDGNFICNDCGARYAFLSDDQLWLHKFSILQ